MWLYTWMSWNHSCVEPWQIGQKSREQQTQRQLEEKFIFHFSLYEFLFGICIWYMWMGYAISMSCRFHTFFARNFSISNVLWHFLSTITICRAFVPAFTHFTRIVLYMTAHKDPFCVNVPHFRMFLFFAVACFSSLRFVAPPLSFSLVPPLSPSRYLLVADRKQCWIDIVYGIHAYVIMRWME